MKEFRLDVVVVMSTDTWQMISPASETNENGSRNLPQNLQGTTIPYPPSSFPHIAEVGTQL
jgi:hypothetical protein